MIIKSFRLNVILRVLLLTGAIFGFEYVWGHENWPMTKLFFVLGILALVGDLIYYVERTNRDLRSFLLAVKHKDFTHTFSREPRGKSFAGLKDAFNQIIESYQDLRAEKESHYQYLQNVIEHVSVALICFRADGSIELMNEAAQHLLNRPYMSHIDVLERVNEDLMEAVRDLGPHERKLVKAVINEELHNIAVQATEFKLQGTHYKLISLQDIRSELDEKEIDTWQKLIRVLTHEIMNSVTPIISLTKVIHGLMSDEQGHRRDLVELDTEDVDDILSSVTTIESRSKGLLHFVHAYRNLTKIKKPQFDEVAVKDMLDRVCGLLKPELDKRGIETVRNLTIPQLRIKADHELIEQVLINLVKNAMEALSDRGGAQIELACYRNNDDRPVIMVRDNGPGIDQEYVDKIFIPFFTTKKKGSGIGLSLSRQIMRLHRGSINFHSSAEEGTTFWLTF
jgi:two-component system, NtrC family, nitrogen regulation sensor histidine kinase NtrY